MDPNGRITFVNGYAERTLCLAANACPAVSATIGHGTSRTFRAIDGQLEERIAERTAGLERLTRVFVGRERKMMELKDRIAELERKHTT